MSEPTGAMEVVQWILSWVDGNTNTKSHSSEATTQKILQALRKKLLDMEKIGSNHRR